MKCNLCKKRYTRQQEWKTDEEKKYCATCYGFLQMVKTVEQAVNLQADYKKIPVKVKYEITNKTS